MVTLVNRAKVNTATTGTGTITLGTAVDGYQTFAAAGVTNGNVVRYVIEDGTSWEIGTGTYTATGSTLTRTVSESSNGGAAISLGGDATIFVGLLASDIVQVSDVGVTVQAYDANIVSDATYVHTDNNYTTAEKSKLAGVEAGATADQTAAQILTAVKTVDGAGSGLDADLLDGNHASAFALASHAHDYVPERSRTDWNDSTVVNDVIGQMAWQNYGNNHTIFDASKSISPSGTSVNNTNSTNAWSATYPTLMGWNGASTYGVRVDVARYADSANTANRAYPKRVGNVDLNFNWSGQSGQPPWLWGGSDGSNMYVYNPSNFSVNYANSAGSVSPPTANTVGSYSFLRAKSSSTRIYPNNTVAGSTMSYTDADWNQYSTPSGTWRCMAYAVAATRPTLYIRIS